jgi:release factor glutamine methyltransferase
MGTGFKGDVYCALPEQTLVLHTIDRMDLGMRPSVFPVPTLTYYMPIMHNNTTDHRIGTYPSCSQQSEIQCPVHVHFIIHIIKIRAFRPNPSKKSLNFDARQQIQAMPSVHLKKIYREILHKLKSLHEDREAKEIAFIILEETLSVEREEILADKKTELSSETEVWLKRVIQDVSDGKPVQYATGKAYCYGRSFIVNPSVLIPRQETEELLFRVIEDHREASEADILDMGTGSGCIAITLALDLPGSRVWALDNDPEALKAARINARTLNARVHLFTFDMLSRDSLPGLYDVIVSNPPYVTESEKMQMHKQVLNHEPPAALFVPDDDPLLFYRHIAKKALDSLHHHGKLYFEINERFAREISGLLKSSGYKEITLFDGLNKKPRIVRAVKF